MEPIYTEETINPFTNILTIAFELIFGITYPIIVDVIIISKINKDLIVYG
jgi:hypothetical protein